VFPVTAVCSCSGPPEIRKSSAAVAVDRTRLESHSHLSRTLTKALPQAKIRMLSHQCGPVAQLGARFHGMEEVIGSIPIRSTKSLQ
jgi:hypothetical protein